MASMLDTNVFNALLDGRLQLCDVDPGGTFVVTHVQLDELRATSTASRRQQLIAQFSSVAADMVPTETAVWGLSDWNGAKWGEGAVFETLLAALNAKNNSKPNNVKDALIAEVAIANGHTLATSDRDLADVVMSLGGKVQDFAY